MLDPRTLRLVAITDSLHDGIDGLAARAAAAVEGGATMLHLRLPEEPPRVQVAVARALLRCAPGVPLVVNERADVALAAKAQGVHVNGDGLAPAALRAVLPPEFVIGISVGSERDAQRVAGADYAAIGPVYREVATEESGAAIGVARFVALAERCGIPSVALGGITAETAGQVLAAGASGLAVISAVFSASNPRAAARALRAVRAASGS